MEKQKNRNQTLDIFKLVASFAVVCIHYMLYGTAGEIVKALSRFAVPFFFAISGYFAYGDSPQKIKRKAKHILAIYLGSFLLYFCYSAFKYILANRTLIEYFLSYVNKTAVLDFFVLNETVSSVHLWFLPALIYCYLIYYVIRGRMPENVMVIISLVLMLLYLIAEEFLPIFTVQLPIYVYGNVFLRSFPCFMLGFAAKKYKLIINERVSLGACLGILGIGIVETVLSFVLFGNSITYLGSILITLALLALAIKYESKIYGKTLVKLSRYSMYIYVFHIAVGGTLQTFLDYLGVGGEILWINTKPFVVFVLTIALSRIIEYVLSFISRKREGNPRQITPEIK